MDVTIGTFNLNNLFSRFNFQGAIKAIKEAGGAATALTVRYEFTDPDNYRIRTFRGKLVSAAGKANREKIASRIKRMNVDVLAVQEVENIDILRRFNRENLGRRYPYQILIEGNDPRFIDVGILSKLPVRGITSYQTEEHPDDPGQRVFGRDLLEVDIWNERRTRKLFTLYNNHLKSNYVPFGQDPVAGQAKAHARRKRQAETIARVVARRMRPDSRFIIVGDMNDTPGSSRLRPMVMPSTLDLVNALRNPVETRPAKEDSQGPGPQTPAWTYRHRKSGQNPEYRLYDQIWLSQALESKQFGAWIDRRKNHGGDGSDHDPAWIKLSL